MKKIIVIYILAASTFSYGNSVPVTEQLTCEQISNPLGIDTKAPAFSWTFGISGRNQWQTAYELIVSDNIKDITNGKGNAWSTGKVLSAQNLYIVYNGIPLYSRKRYYWRVKIYGENGENSGWSKIAWFETAFLDAKDWKAKWIGDGSRNPVHDEDYYRDDRMPLFRRSFSISKKIKTARLYISGLGYYEAYLNGKTIGDHVLDPGFTTYRKQVLYVVHDITALTNRGENVAGIMLGSGWWNPLPFKFFGRWNLRDYQQTARPCVKAEIHITYLDGSTEQINTDSNWKTAPGPVIFNNVYLGEKYDARLEQKAWNSKETDDKVWKNAVVEEGPSGELTAQMQPAIKVTKVIQPVSIKAFKPGVFIADMGQNFAGVARIKVRGVAGTKITLRYGEDIYADGSLNVMTTTATQIKKGAIKGGPGAPETAWQEDSYILKGEGLEVWSPRFTFHGFQYVEITGWPGTPAVGDIEGLRMNSDLETKGTFACSNDMFNKLHEVIQWTFLSNVFSVQSDCPGREKMGYGGDIVATANAFIYNYDMYHFYNKAIRDFANEQRPQGGITEIAPFTGIDDRGYGDLSGPLGWQLAFPFMQQQLYEYYGDRRIIERYYPAFKRQLDFLASKALNNVFYWDISDHEALDAKPESFSAVAFYYHHVQLGAAFATILGIREDAEKYNRLAGEIRSEILQRFSIKNTGRFDNATQSAQLFALWYGLSPDKDKTIKVLLDEFARHSWHLSTGIFSTKMLFDVMRMNNMNEVAYRIADQRDFPGWGYMIEKGATTLWETWAFPENDPSRNHPMFGSVDEWFYRSLLGINPASPGFEKIIINPQPVTALQWAKGSYASVRGIISVDWKKENGRFILHTSIPPNTSATVYIPAKENAAVTESNISLNKKREIKLTGYKNGFAIIEINSGSYTFETALINSQHPTTATK
ncbi:MAG: family 78 glycoside hydrolase catalytic domain [Chitinophagaceae bacterium]|nr:family 78 glycoside hydrolase catalytic domain [Chitinophagaceae bacterium]